MANLVTLDPVGETSTSFSKKPMRKVTDLQGQRMAFLWGQHQSTRNFFPVFEEEVVSMYEPKEVIRLHKDGVQEGRDTGGSATPTPMSLIEEIASKVDYAVMGVGA